MKYENIKYDKWLILNKQIIKQNADDITNGHQTCKGCMNSQYVKYGVSNELWNKVVGIEIVLCLDCFLKLAKYKNVKINDKIDIELIVNE